MKTWQWIIVIAALIAVVWFLFRYSGDIHRDITQITSSARNGQQPVTIGWQTVDRPQDGFQVEMPATPKPIQVPAYESNGSTEPVQMLSANPGGDSTFAVAWEDDPPVAQANPRAPGKMLEEAKRGMLARTNTSLVTESRPYVGGFPALDVTAKNSEGGVLDARLIYINGRLYGLFATFPSLDARREQDVIRFYNSFTRQQPSQPAAGGKGSG